MSKIKVKNRLSAFVELRDYCIFSMEDDNSDFLEVTQWSNGEGYDITISKKTENNFSLTWGQFEALKKCIKQIEKEM